MKTTYTTFKITLENGEECTVRYCDKWGSRAFGSRTIHFEFLDSVAVSATGYRSEFRVVKDDLRFDPQQTARELIKQLTGIQCKNGNRQLKLL